MEINRFLKIPDHSFLLLGPRGTGKSTLIKQKLNNKLYRHNFLDRNIQLGKVHKKQ